jgi:hypothetical protein
MNPENNFFLRGVIYKKALVGAKLTAPPMSFKPRIEGLFRLSREERDGRLRPPPAKIEGDVTVK